MPSQKEAPETAVPHFASKHELENEQITIHQIERAPTRRGRHDAWKATGSYDGLKVIVDLYPEDARMIEAAGYDISWKSSQAQEAVNIEVVLKWTQAHGYRISEVVPIGEMV
jgi:hypothetical protein